MINNRNKNITREELQQRERDMRKDIYKGKDVKCFER